MVTKIRCLVTGASGFVGSSLVATLAQRGFAVDAVCHRGIAPSAAVTVQRADLADDAASVDFSGIDTVFHLAGVAHQNADADLYRRLNIEATIDIAQGAAAAGVRCFVFVSSVKAQAFDPPEPHVHIPLSTASGGELDYGRSKWEAETALKARFAAGSMQLLIVRPALVYSAEAPGHLGLLRRWTALRLPRPPRGGCRSMIALDDLVRLLTLLPERDWAGAVVDLTITDGECYTTRRLHDAVCRASGKRPLLPSPPGIVWRASCAVVDRLRGQPAGSTWQRLAGEERYRSHGLDVCRFSPKLTFESSLGLHAP